MAQGLFGLAFRSFCCVIPNYISMVLNDVGIFPSMLRFSQKFESEKTHMV
jgi:hypothetical protein